MKTKAGNDAHNQLFVEAYGHLILQSQYHKVVVITPKDKTIRVFESYNRTRTTGYYRNIFMKENGFEEMATLKGFKHYMELGQVRDYKIIKMFEN